MENRVRWDKSLGAYTVYINTPKIRAEIGFTISGIYTSSTQACQHVKAEALFTESAEFRQNREVNEVRISMMDQFYLKSWLEKLNRLGWTTEVVSGQVRWVMDRGVEQSVDRLGIRLNQIKDLFCSAKQVKLCVLHQKKEHSSTLPHF